MIVEHIGITVSDIERSIDFYTKVFGFSVLRRTSTHGGAQTRDVAYLYLGNDMLELTQSMAPVKTGRSKKAQRPGTPDGWLKHMRESVGLRHIGFRVDVGDMDETIEKIKKLGGKLVVPPMEFKVEYKYAAVVTDEKLSRAIRQRGKSNWRLAMFCDPDDVLLEILER